jgi:HEAT repeat protein
MARALLFALQQASNQEEYTAYLENAVLTSEDLLAHGELPLLSELLNLLLLQSQEAPESFRSLLAQKSLEAFRTREVIDKIVDLLDGPRKRPYADLYALAKVLGPEIVPATVDLYGQRTSPYALNFLTDLLTHFKQRAQIEIEHRLTRGMALIPAHLFILIRDLGLEADLAATLRQLLDHADPKVQDEALEALIRIKDGTAVNILLWLIASENKEGYEKGAEMAVRFNVVETVPYLVSAINHALFLMRDHPKKVAMLRALGRMGAAEAVPVLEAVARKKWAISRRKLTQLKVALFQTLDGFRPDQIENLIKIGYGLSNPQITAALRRWRNQGKGKI